jgi:LPS sulfotransferase NodH
MVVKMDCGPDKHPVNFILLGHQRCGSNLLVRALNEHPQIRMVGEVLAENPVTRKEAWSWTEPGYEGFQAGQQGAEFMERVVFGPPTVWRPFLLWENVRARGCKLFYDQARFDPDSATAWDYVLSHDVRVIHLIRKNLLYALISLEVAERTQRWHQIVEDTTRFPPLPPFELDPAVCEAYFERISGWRKWAEESFAKHRVLTVDYEDELCADFRGTTLRVFDFLGAVVWHCRPGLVKQQTVTASRQITNFEELRRHFCHTAYEGFFEHDSIDAIRSA